MFWIIICILLWLFDKKEPYTLRSKDYDIIPNLITSEECNHIIEMAKKIGMTKSEIRDHKIDKTYRQSETCWIGYNKHPIIKKLYDKLEKIVNKPKKDFEMMQVVHYYPDGFFNWHYDQCNDKYDWCQNEIKRFNGYRLYTILIYLNEDYTDGETEFRNGDKIKLKKGDAIIFKNVDDNCKILYNSYHKGTPITDGEKWICNIWIRGYCNLKK